MSVQIALERLAGDLSQSATGINAYHDRSLTPGQTFAAIKPHFAELGITRVGLLTALDLLDIPVAFATRPNSYTLSVFQGKGIDEEAAMTSAAMEAVETRVAEIRPDELIVATLASMKAERAPMIDLDSVARCVPSDIGDAPLEWCEGLDIVSNRPVFVPWSLVGLDHRGTRPSGFEQSSDGLASGNRPAEAVLHGLCELVERDAWALTQLRPHEHLRGSRIDPAAFGDPVLDIVVDRITRAGMRILLIDMTTDIGVPSYLAVIIPDNLGDRVDARWTQVCGGCGCHPDPIRAALRAITEAAQSRLTAIAGSRDDFSPRLYQRLDADGPMQQLISLCDEKPVAPRFDFEPTSRSIQENIHHILERLQARGIEQVVAVPLEHPRLPVTVVRMIVPGLEVDVSGEFIQLGLRAVGAMQGVQQ
jgi:ribosomal protein S12 methylthiotransferase accessory factor